MITCPVNKVWVKLFIHPTRYNGYNYLSMLGLKLLPVCKRSSWSVVDVLVHQQNMLVWFHREVMVNMIHIIIIILFLHQSICTTVHLEAGWAQTLFVYPCKMISSAENCPPPPPPPQEKSEISIKPQKYLNIWKCHLYTMMSFWCHNGVIIA